MPTDLKTAFEAAAANIAALGDTDVFALPPENHVFYDRPADVVSLLLDLHADFGTWRDQHPPVNESALAMIGYTAFRWVTQLDPLWNAYLLGLVLSLAEDIESARVPREQDVVFSYRYDYDAASGRLFADSAWRDFNVRSLALAGATSHVLVCDIADFYARVYHHRVENALLVLHVGADLPKRIDRVLSLFSAGDSYGLPVGGPAARILSELLLNRVDRLLLAQGLRFCRFADDYHIFTESREAAYDALRFLTEKLLQNEGLTLQRAKTRILTTKDLISGSAYAGIAGIRPSRAMNRRGRDKPDSGLGAPTDAALGDNADDTTPTTDGDDRDAADDTSETSFLSLSLRFDPYSPTAKEDYETLKQQVEQFDITGMLARELAKSRIHAALTRRLLQAIRYVEPDARDGAVRALIDNIETLTPVFPNVMRALADAYEELGRDTQDYVDTAVREMISERRYYVVVPVNLGYAVRLLGRHSSEESQALLAQVFQQAPHFVQRDIMLIMGRWRATYWLSDQRLQFSRMHPWVQRAFLLSSYVLEDEGSHWRRRTEGQLGPFEKLLNEWMAKRTQTSGWEVPL